MAALRIAPTLLLVLGLQLALAAHADGATATHATDDTYVVQPGDLLQVSVWKEQDLQGEVLVRPDGGMSFALAGDFQAAGHTVEEVRKILVDRIGKYVPNPVITVAVKAANGARIYVVGRVNRPGDFALIRPIDVMQALSLAGGATPYAEVNKIRILRREGGRELVFEFRYDDVRRGRDLSQNIVLHSGDTVVVP